MTSIVYFSIPNARVDQYRVRSFNLTDQTPESWLAEMGSTRCAYFVSELNHNTAERLVCEHIARDTSLSNQSWAPENLPEGIRWFGVYRMGRVVSNTTRLVETDYTSAHAAFIAARAAYAGIEGLVYACSPTATDYLDEMCGPRGELVGEVVENYNTTCLPTDQTWTQGCTNCGFPGHNARTCHATPKAHDKIGIEVEGRYESMRRANLTDEHRGGADGSLRCSEFRNDVEAWEYQTRPGSLLSAITQLNELYPDETGPDCGLHVHISFVNQYDIALLATQPFFRYFRSRLLAWGESMGLSRKGQFFRRLFGKNSYCNFNPERDPDTTDQMTNMHRYAQINFSAWREHKTVEVRLLPMFRHRRMALAAVIQVVRIFEDWLGEDCENQIKWPHSVSACLPNHPEPSVWNGEVEIPAEYKAVTYASINYKTPPDTEPGFRRIVVTSNSNFVIRATDFPKETACV